MDLLWHELDTFSTSLARWQDDAAVDDGQWLACERMAKTLADADLAKLFSDPRIDPIVLEYRQRNAIPWAKFNVPLEYRLAQTLDRSCPDYASFRASIDRHWLTRNSLPEEIAILRGHGLKLRGLKVVIIGPGPIPYTALSLAQEGALVTLIDVCGNVLAWSEKWFDKFGLGGQLSLHQGAGEDFDYRGYELVMVASMLFNKPAVLAQVDRHRPGHALIRTTSCRRPPGILAQQLGTAELSQIPHAGYLARTTTPATIANFSLLYCWSSQCRSTGQVYGAQAGK